MRLAFLGSPDSWYLNDLLRAAADRHEITPLAFRDLASTLSSSGTMLSSGSCRLSEIDAVLVRTMP
ncbi:MAG TPA: hypothetical protein VND64_29885, partial [Pirellulales bacterium]|nr:hypothetical protein [Pirellulales bacterium]